MQGGSGGIDAGVDAYLFCLEDFVEDVAVAVLARQSCCCGTRAIHTTTNPAISLM